MNKLPLLAVLLLSGFSAIAQTCTVTGSSPLNWPTNGSGISCSEGGNAVGKTTLIIPAGFTVIFNNNGDTWTGTTMEVYGTLRFTANPTLNTSIRVKNGGLVDVQGNVSLGSAAGCGYSLVLETGGTMDVASGGGNKLSICGTIIAQGVGGCNSCGGTNSARCAYNGSPYCEPAGGFQGSAGYDETGYNASLPVTLLYFRAEAFDEKIILTWATTMEEAFSRFLIQRASDGVSFEDIGEVKGKGFDIYDIETKYSFEDPVPLSGSNYYRLKAVDLDDSFEYFDVRLVRLNGRKRIAVYPNPSSGKVISFRTNFNPSESDVIILTDQLGIEIFRTAASGTENTILLPDKLQPGVYVLRYVSGSSGHSTRVVVKN